MLIMTALIAATFTCSFAAVTYHDDAADAAAELREAMRERKPEVTVGLTGSTDEESLKKAIGELLDRSVEHTGKPDEGDYINFQYASYKGEAKTTSSGLTPAVEITYKLEYYDTAEQEAEVDKKVKEIIEGLDLGDKTVYEKIRAIHDYICDNTEYEESEDDEDIRRTAYGALVEGKAVCQGYTLALYRLLLEAGIDNRIIFGTGIDKGHEGPHTWNIVELCGSYYYIDVTWDDSTRSDDYFLKPAGAGFESEHVASDEYEEDFFDKQYPLAKEEFREDMNGLLMKTSEVVKLLASAMQGMAAGTFG